MSQYPQPPPSYGSNSSSPKPGSTSRDDAREPLLASSSHGGIFDQPQGDDLPDDFKYGSTVSECAPEIRAAFVRKVYSILVCQIFATVVVGGFLSQSQSTVAWVQNNVWAFYLPLFGTLVNLGLLHWKRHHVPWNFALLSTFTLMESFTLGIVMAFYDNKIILQALIITLGVFIGLTLFTLQSKYDFDGMGPFLFAGLIALCMTGVVGIFFPFSKTMDLIYAIGGTLLFSGYIVYDTFLINARLSYDEYIMASISLYLDFINLFLSILRLLNNIQDN
ncbi:glutamate binding protein [Roridomyces roridus]|uniref:Glutamate binding protein n=1 Tax=Roridomyces roridus TaxID=1738132 RepID=A0AAD7CF13_9AGAR|nr:glutamate binding protein [Roridomyces roridus]